VTDARPAAVVVLAAGEGTRMKSAGTPKVLHPLGGRTMLGHVVAAARALGPEHLVVVVGHGREQVTAALAELDAGATAVVQEQQHGTGHAVRVALEALPTLTGTVVVVPGDAPLLTAATLGRLVEVHQAAGASTTLLTAELEDPTGYGRVVRDGGSVVAVVEHKDADEATRALREVATSVYAFDAAALADSLQRLTTDNAQGEEYLTDVVGLHRAAGLAVTAHLAEDPDETMGVNDRVQLATAGRLLRDRVVERHQRAGVTVVDPLTTWVDVDVQVGQDAVLHPGHAAARPHHGRRRCRRRPGQHPDRHRGRAGGARGRLDLHRRGRRPGRRRRPVHLPAARHPARHGQQGRRLRRGQGQLDRRRQQGAAPVLRRGRDRRGAQQHRCGDRLRQLRRARQAPHDGRRRRPDRQRQHAGRAADDRRRRLHGRRLGHHPGRAGRGARRRPGRQRNVEGWVARRRGRPAPTGTDDHQGTERGTQQP
jgi:CTP:molybdopterin cytidylyltransferase MocA